MSPTPSRSKAMMWDSKPLGAAPLSFGYSAGQGTQQLSLTLLPIMFFYRMPQSLTFTGESISCICILKFIQWNDRFMDPLFFGDYPSSMRKRVGNRLPSFTTAEAALVKGSLDFVGVNHYTTYYAKHNSTNIIGILLNDTLADSGAMTLPFKNGKAIGHRVYFNEAEIVISPRYHLVLI
ncbi:hypothetical protein BHE74_00010232 [Ensete ventricosum]|uniref:4-hydroxy-7-methoxy-3-oxo-3,4-dihydro-2H-1,4-benzoxazin-2-yl glucosidebeta-D-glucosidase n=1 Tax=Ensete ventricosum TaxID=4639 RepID=A0A427AYD8_ENSVE|nr:hypothetical protein B296_00022338 [Ensete ventricosum]RWW81392.1 hypothetical protein BHE74_00010232 [Ensete ventricosum]